MALVAHPEWTVRRKGEGVATISGGHHTIKHVYASRDPLQQIDGTSNSHQVTRLIARQDRTCDVQNAIHLLGRFPDTQTADRISVEADSY